MFPNAKSFQFYPSGGRVVELTNERDKAPTDSAADFVGPDEHDVRVDAARGKLFL